MVSEPIASDKGATRRAGEFCVIPFVFHVGFRCLSWTDTHFKAECCVCIFISNEIGMTGFQ